MKDNEFIGKYRSKTNIELKFIIDNKSKYFEEAIHAAEYVLSERSSQVEKPKDTKAETEPTKLSVQTVLKMSLNALMVLISLLWIYVSATYYRQDQLVEFYFSQFVFIPLLTGLILFPKNNILAIITLMSWFSILYVALNGPFHEYLKFVPPIVIAVYLAIATARIKAIELKAIAVIVIVLSSIIMVRLLGLENMLFWTVINEILHLSIPILLILYVRRNYLQMENQLGIMTIIMSIIIILDLVIDGISNHVKVVDSSILNTSTIITIFSLFVTVSILSKSNKFPEIKQISLAYFVWTIVVETGLWVVYSIEKLS